MIVESSVTIDRPVEEVFAFVSDSTNDPKWHTDAIDGTKTSEGPIGLGTTFTIVIKFMGRRETLWKVTQWEPGRREVIEVTSKPLNPTLTYLFEPAGGGTKFTRRIDVSPGGFFGIVMPLMGGMMRKQNAGFLEKLKTVLEG